MKTNTETISQGQELAVTIKQTVIFMPNYCCNSVCLLLLDSAADTRVPVFVTGELEQSDIKGNEKDFMTQGLSDYR